MTIRRSPLVAVWLLFCVAGSASAQTPSENPAAAQTPSENWCKDTGTWCPNAQTTHPYFAGIRFIAEPKLGVIFARADNLNRLNPGDFANFTLVGAETNLWHQILSLQGVLITPGKATFDSLSPLVKDKRLLNPGGEVAVDSGFAVGVSFFDGVLAVGIGRLNFDARQIVNPVPAETRVRFTYFNVQAISAVRAAIKASK